MQETELTEANNKTSSWTEKVLKELSASTPKFRTKTEAIEALAAELLNLASHRSVSVQSLLDLASSSVENHDDLDRSLRISSLIYSLKNS